MKAHCKVWLIALLACLPVMWGATPAVAAPTPDHLPTTKTPQSVRFTIEGTIDTSGGTIPVTGSGAVSGSDLMLEMEMSAPLGAGGPDKVMVGMIAKGDMLYVKLPNLSTGEDAKWYVTSKGGAGGLDPMMGFDMVTVHRAMKIKSTAKETLNGTAVTRYNIDVDTKALDPFRGQPPPDGPQFDTTMSLTMWVGDADMYVHKLSTRVESVATVGETTSFMRVNMEVLFSGFSTPVVIEAPANAEELDFRGALGETPLVGLLGGVIGRPTGMPITGSFDMVWSFGLLALGFLCLMGGVIVRSRAAVRYQTITNKDRYWTEHSK